MLRFCREMLGTFCERHSGNKMRRKQHPPPKRKAHELSWCLFAHLQYNVTLLKQYMNRCYVHVNFFYNIYMVTPVLEN